MKRKDDGVKRPVIKLKLDSKTVVMVHSLEAVQKWKKRYPLAEIIS